jgi:deoxyribose-phosphate aldolase
MKIQSLIDHTLLRQDATGLEIKKLCSEAREWQFKSVCVNPTHVALAKKELEGSGVLVCTVVGFPLGATPSEVKAYETKKAIADGAQEIDMVINIGALKEANYQLLVDDIKAVVAAANGTLVKVIIETCLLNDDEKIKATEAVIAAKAQFVKTSTGFSKGGATKEDVELLAKTIKGHGWVKASGGIKTAEDAAIMVEAGADRIGTSSGIKIVTDWK